MNDSCYTATSKTPGTVPAVFCLETAQLDGQFNYLMTAGTFSNLPSALKVKSYQHITEDRVSFIAEANVLNIWNSGCGDGEFATLTIKGISEIGQNEEINPKALTLSVDYSATNDTCHSQPQDQTITYILSK